MHKAIASHLVGISDPKLDLTFYLKKAICTDAVQRFWTIVAQYKC